MGKKLKTVFFCRNCGSDSPKWIGKCPSCGEWNTYVEEVVEASGRPTPSFVLGERAQPVKLNDVETTSEARFATCFSELDRVLGGGIVKGSIILVGGDPGIGKSTLILQVALQLSDKKILYISGEESQRQISMRAARLAGSNENLMVLCDTDSANAISHAQQLLPDLVIVDSIQTMSTDRVESSPGSISQVRECTGIFLKYAKESNTPVILIGHITKDGMLAGPKVLEHMVDTVLQFEGDKNYLYRILRSVKNRFGSTSEIGIFEMRQDGMREVLNPSELLLNREHDGLSGMTVAGAIEGVRPLLIEVQALVSSAVYGTPQRSATGFDLRRMNMLLAVLEKKVGFKLGAKDVFLNIAGGIKVDDPGVDLSVLCAVLSSSLDRPLPTGFCLCGEVGLSGEVRPVSRIEQRVAEAAKLGFKEIIIPQANQKGLRTMDGIKVTTAKQVEEVFRVLFKKE